MLFVLDHFPEDLVLDVRVLNCLVDDFPVHYPKVRLEVRDGVVPVLVVRAKFPRSTSRGIATSSLGARKTTVKLVLWAKPSVEFVLLVVHEHSVSHTFVPVVPELVVVD